MTYEVNFDYYQGPFEKLLDLIDEKKLELNRVSLAAVTADFLQYLEKISQLDEKKITSELLADFISAASKLLLIKSKTLLPSLELSEEEESEVKDFEKRLKFLQFFKPAQILIKNQWHEKPMMARREFMLSFQPIFYPPPSIKKEDFTPILIKLLTDLEQFLKPQIQFKNKIVHLKTKIEEVLKRLTDQPLSFQVLKSGQSRSETVVLFLAILHLIKERLIVVEQDAHFEEIRISRRS